MVRMAWTAEMVLVEANIGHLVRVEKYRPVFLDDIVGNTETVERLKIIARDGNMPHLIISGMPGIGKTTSVLCLARQLLGDAYKEAVLELNASDERGWFLFVPVLFFDLLQRTLLTHNNLRYRGRPATN